MTSKKDALTSYEAAYAWLKSGIWKKGLSLNTHDTTDVVTFYKQYSLNTHLWDAAFKFLSRPDLKVLTTGKYDIIKDEVFAMISDNPTIDQDDCNWESHKKYIDIQYVIRGQELFGICAIDVATVTVPYDEEKDFITYKASGQLYPSETGTFFLFFPNDVHQPFITTGDYGNSKKVVIKVKVAE